MIRTALVVVLAASLVGGCGTLVANRVQLQQFQSLCEDIPPETFGGGWVLMPPLSGEAQQSLDEVKRQWKASETDPYRKKVEQLRAVCKSERPGVSPASSSRSR
jgi:hypothetical protein